MKETQSSVILRLTIPAGLKLPTVTKEKGEDEKKELEEMYSKLFMGGNDDNDAGT